MTGRLEQLVDTHLGLRCPSAVPEDRLVGWRVDGHWLVLARFGSQLRAYRELCPGCGSSLVQAPVRGELVTCPVCDETFDLGPGSWIRPGPRQRLESVPVTGEDEESLLRRLQLRDPVRAGDGSTDGGT